MDVKEQITLQQHWNKLSFRTLHIFLYRCQHWLIIKAKKRGTYHEVFWKITYFQSSSLVFIRQRKEVQRQIQKLKMLCKYFTSLQLGNGVARGSLNGIVHYQLPRVMELCVHCSKLIIRALKCEPWSCNLGGGSSHIFLPIRIDVYTSMPVNIFSNKSLVFSMLLIPMQCKKCLNASRVWNVWWIRRYLHLMNPRFREYSLLHAFCLLYQVVSQM